jgi:hypothetical protein
LATSARVKRLLLTFSLLIVGMNVLQVAGSSCRRTIEKITPVDMIDGSDSKSVLQFFATD